MKKTTLLWSLLFICSFTKAQTFHLENEDFINFETKEIVIDIDNFSYKGYYENFNSKYDKKEYLIYSYFSRSIVIELNKPISEINNTTKEVKIKSAIVIHNNDLKSLKKVICRKGVKNLNNFIIIHNSSRFETPFLKKDII